MKVEKLEVQSTAGHVLRQRRDAPGHPALGHRVHHALAADDLAGASRVFAEAVRGLGGRLRLAHAFRGQDLGQYGDGHEDEAARDGEPAEPTVKDEDRAKKERREGQVHQCGEGGRGVVGLDRLEIPAGGQRLGRRGPLALKNLGAEDAVVQRRLEPRAIACNEAGTREVEKPHQPVKHDDEDQERHQRLFRPRPQHAVIDLEHEERAGQHQDVDEDAEEESVAQEVPGLLPCRVQGGRLGRGFGLRRHDTTK